MKTHILKQTPKQVHVSPLDCEKYIPLYFKPGTEITITTPTQENYTKGKGYITIDTDLKDENTGGAR